jgi:hypothetical protein
VRGRSPRQTSAASGGARALFGQSGDDALSHVERASATRVKGKGTGPLGWCDPFLLLIAGNVAPLDAKRGACDIAAVSVRWRRRPARVSHLRRAQVQRCRWRALCDTLSTRASAHCQLLRGVIWRRVGGGVSLGGRPPSDGRRRARARGSCAAVAPRSPAPSLVRPLTLSHNDIRQRLLDADAHRARPAERGSNEQKRGLARVPAMLFGTARGAPCARALSNERPYGPCTPVSRRSSSSLPPPRRNDAPPPHL